MSLPCTRREVMLKKLFHINVWQSLLILSVLSLPLFFKLTDSGTPAFLSARLSGRYGSVFFLLAFSLYLFLYAIPRLPRSKAHRKLVQFTRVYIRFHIAFALLGLLFIFWHAFFMFMHIPPATAKMITGAAALIALLPLIVTGYLRKRKSSGKRRRYHRYSAFLFAAAVLIHFVL